MPEFQARIDQIENEYKKLREEYGETGNPEIIERMKVLMREEETLYIKK